MRLLFWALLVIGLVPLLISCVGMYLWVRQLPWEETLGGQPTRERNIQKNQRFIQQTPPPYV